MAACRCIPNGPLLLGQEERCVRCGHSPSGIATPPEAGELQAAALGALDEAIDRYRAKRAAHTVTTGRPVKLTTAAGMALEISEADGACYGCDRPGKVARVQVDESTDVALCGTCVAEGFAILLGRRHVQAGGTVDDLDFAGAIDPAEGLERPDGSSVTGAARQVAQDHGGDIWICPPHDPDPAHPGRCRACQADIPII